MLAQFKKAAQRRPLRAHLRRDEIARGEVALMDPRQATRRSAACRWPASRLGAPTSRIDSAPPPSHNPPSTKDPSMATHLDLEEQEQLDQLKAFWKQYGNLITWVLIARCSAPTRPGTAGTGGSATRRQGRRDVRRARPRRAGRRRRPCGALFADLKERYPRTAFAQQAALLAAKLQPTRARPTRPRHARLGGRAARARTSTSARAPAPGRLLLDQKKYDEALKQLDASTRPEFDALAPTAAATSCSRRARRTRRRPPTARPGQRWMRSSTTAASSRPS
jgi:hypothetical protein